jgi:hypothetical protein
VRDESNLKLERTEALELLVVVQATLNAIARSRDLTVGAAVAAAALLAERAAQEASDRDRVIRIAKREGATLRALADATGLSRQTIANICAAGASPAKRRARAS